MKVAGIIAEYDPFHNGHAAHIAATRAAGATHIVAVMSGNFTQRGEPAAVPKTLRAQMALKNGADLIIELPVPWAMASAERFAAGGIALLDAMGNVDTVSFGSECGSIELLTEAASLSEREEYRTALHDSLDGGIPYAAAVQEAVCAVDPAMASVLSAPNNILGIEYIRAARRSQTPFSFFTVPRIGTEHNSTVKVDAFASASGIRQELSFGHTEEACRYMPPSAAAILSQAVRNGMAPADAGKAATAILMRLRLMSQEDWATVPYISEGLQNRLARAAKTATDLESLFSAVKTRRYPLTRLRRIVWAAMLGIPVGTDRLLPPYIRILGMTARGKELLSGEKRLPLVSRYGDIAGLDTFAQKIYALEERATDLHALLLPKPLPSGTDRTAKMINI